jgi:hypothetical protein
MQEPDDHMPVLNQIDYQIPECNDLSDNCRRRLLGRFGSDALHMVNSAQPGEFEIIPGTNYHWAELRWAARSEGVCHLDDLLLRRTRLGLILPHGAESILPKVKNICLVELYWNENRWQKELTNYQQLWNNCYSLPSIEIIPDWKQHVQEAITKQKLLRINRRKKMMRRSSLAGIIFILCASLITYLTWRHSSRSNQRSRSN